jgi:hypothetical protein
MTSNTAEYMRRYRADHPDYVKRGRAQHKARSRALEMLAQRHPDEFNQLRDAELNRIEALEAGAA